MKQKKSEQSFHNLMGMSKFDASLLKEISMKKNHYLLLTALQKMIILQHMGTCVPLQPLVYSAVCLVLFRPNTVCA